MIKLGGVMRETRRQCPGKELRTLGSFGCGLRTGVEGGVQSKVVGRSHKGRAGCQDPQQVVETDSSDRRE